MSAEIAAVLRRAADLLAEPERWCQGHAYESDKNGNVVRRCLMGAVIDAMVEFEPPPDPCAVRWALWRHLMLDPERWNDRPERRHAEVLAALRAAAEAEERNG